MITAAQFLDGVRKNVARVDRYELGQDGRNGACDCIGLIIGALRLMGETWNGTHGSNYAARNMMVSVQNIKEDEMMPGDIVYKAKWPGDSGYALPAKYKNDADQKDYYHVGVVTAVKPLEITHCTGVPGGIKRDSKLGNWTHSGKLWLVKDGEEVEQVAQIMQVRSENGGPVFLRMNPNKDAGWYDRIPVGTLVEVTDWQGAEGWANVLVDMGYEMAGYMMREYLSPVTAEPAAPPAQENTVTITVEKQLAQALMLALQDALK